MPIRKSIVIILREPVQLASLIDSFHQIGRSDFFGLFPYKKQTYDYLERKYIDENVGFIQLASKRYILDFFTYPDDSNDLVQALEFCSDEPDFSDDFFEIDEAKKDPILRLVNLLVTEIELYSMLIFLVDYKVSIEDILESYRNKNINNGRDYDVIDGPR